MPHVRINVCISMSLACLSQMGVIDKVRCSHALTDLYTLYKSVYTYVHTYVDSYVCTVYIHATHHQHFAKEARVQQPQTWGRLEGGSYWSQSWKINCSPESLLCAFTLHCCQSLFPPPSLLPGQSLVAGKEVAPHC